MSEQYNVRYLNESPIAQVNLEQSQAVIFTAIGWVTAACEVGKVTLGLNTLML